jgi:outer membrane receptor protein involved in Fe transport
MQHNRTIASLLVTTALGSALFANAAQAQGAAAPAAAPKSVQLEDVVVTATRQTSSANRVALSIAAVTQKTLDEQGIKSVNDLQRTVPALTISGVTAGVATFALRGIVGTGATAATTGVYLDDIPLQKRSTNGVSQNNGTPAPPLFDLDRVEVLRGPQGTLFGGGSEGGTIRFISPLPSLTTYAVNARTEVSTTEYGSPSYEGGISAGGPIIKDKLGFRATGYTRYNGGYIDEVNPYNPDQIRFKDANWSKINSYRLALLWNPIDKLKVGLSYFTTSTNVGDTTSSSMLPVNRTLTTPSYCITNKASNVVYSTSSSIAPNVCTGVNQYVRPAQSYGPFNFKPFQTLSNNSTLTNNPASSRFSAPSFTIDYALPFADIKSITSNINDQENSINWEQQQVAAVSGFTDKSGNYYAPGSTVAFASGAANVTAGSILFRPFPDYAGAFKSRNRRDGWTQEIRLSSNGDPKPLSWVAGVYYSSFHTHTFYQLPESIDQIAQLLYNIPAIQRYSQRFALSAGQTCASLGLPASQPVLDSAGACFVGLPAEPGGITTERDQQLTEKELAGFGEVNFWITKKLKLNGGLRYSSNDLNYTQVFDGPASGWNVPTVANTGITSGRTKSTPLTPKFGVEYDLADREMVYFTAAKGFRNGGVNVPLPVAICGQGLALVGLTVADAPATYNSDTVWSYEVGGKFRLLDRFQLNASAFRIDWKDVQLAVTVPGCGPNFITNAGQARSQGMDLQFQGRLLDSLVADVAIGYDDAKFTTTATGPVPKNGTPATPVINAGDALPVAPWTVSLGLTYRFEAFKLPMFIRGDWQYSSAYHGSFGPGVNSYTPDSRNLPSTSLINARWGLTVSKNIDVSAFANNLTGSTDALGLAGGRSGCTPNTDASCAVFTTFTPFISKSTFRPRTVGVQLNYKY